MDSFRYSTTRCRSETFITLPGGVSFLISIHNDLSLGQRKSLLRRVFRLLKPVLREVGRFYTRPEFDPMLDPRSALRTGSLGSIGNSHELEAIRATLGLSQIELASLSGVSRFQISRIEQGRIQGSTETWLKIRRAIELHQPSAAGPATSRNF